MEEPQTKECPAQTVIAIEREGPHSDIGRLLRMLREWADAHDLEVTGPGSAVFLGAAGASGTKSGRFEVRLPVASAAEGDREVGVKELPACKVAYVRVEGPYSEIPARYTEMLSWLAMMNVEIAGPPREVYIRRPGPRGSGDGSRLLTEIQFPIWA